MRRNPLEAGLFGLGLAAVINGCVTATPEPQPTIIPILVPTATPHVRVEPTATPTPPSVLGKTPILPMPESTPVPKPLSEFASLEAELMYPTTKSITIKGLSFAEFMRQKGYEVFIARVIPPHNGIVVKEEAFVTRILPDENAQALPEEYSLKAGSKLTSIKYIVQVIKAGPTKENEPKQQQWIARLVYLPAEEGRPPIPTLVYNKLEDGYNNKGHVRVETFIILRPSPPLPTEQV